MRCTETVAVFIDRRERVIRSTVVNVTNTIAVGVGCGVRIEVIAIGVRTYVVAVVVFMTDRTNDTASTVRKIVHLWKRAYASRVFEVV